MPSTHESTSLPVQSYYHLQALPCAKPLVQTDPLPEGQLVIICEREDIELGQVLSGKLRGSALKISAVSYKTLRIQPLFLKESEPQIVLVVLPRLLTVGAEEAEVRQATTRLYTVLNSLQHYQPETLLVAQFSDGQFGLDPASFPHLEQVGWRSVLTNWSSQYPQGKARLIDCDSSTPLGMWSDLVIAALQMPGAFKTLSKRHEDYYQLCPVVQECKSIAVSPLKAQSVMMVLDVQSPLITIYAATLAQQTGVSLALVGQEDLVTNEAMQRVIQHCLQAGIRVRYYACDLTEETAVVATVQQIQSDYEAPIENVIYGALSEHSASNKASHSVDQVRGVIHLTQSLPQLVGWISVIAADALLGAKHDYWAGYTAELIYAYLVNQRKKRPQLSVQMVGIGDIPINQGVEALLPLSILRCIYPLFIGEQAALALWGEHINPQQPPELSQLPVSVDASHSTEPDDITITPSFISESDELSITHMTAEPEPMSEHESKSEPEPQSSPEPELKLEPESELEPEPESEPTLETEPEPESPVILLKSEAKEVIVNQSRLWVERNFTDPTSSSAYVTADMFGRWQAEGSLDILRPLMATVLNAEPRIVANQVECLDFLVDGHQETTTRVYIADFNTSRLVLKYEHWGKNTANQYYQVAQGNVILGYGVRCLERWLELPFPAEVVDKIRDFLKS